MLFSFILVTRNFTPKFEATFNSIKNQLDKDFEIILVLDRNISENSKNNFGKDIFWANSNIKLVLSNTAQGVAASYNTAITVASGKYIKFVNEGDELEPNFVKILREKIEQFNQTKIDIYEYTVKLTGMVSTDTVTYLEKNKIYKMEENHDPLAYANQTLFNKLFNTELLQNYCFKFRRFVRFDSLFIYKVLTLTKTYVHIENDITIESIVIEKVDYSVFDAVNQWVHIFNYYRRIGKFKIYKEYLDYAYFKNVVHIWIWTISNYDNKVLMKKAIDYVNKKFVNRITEFTTTNEIFKESKDAKFVEICSNFSKYMKDLQKMI